MSHRVLALRLGELVRQVLVLRGVVPLHGLQLASQLSACHLEGELLLAQLHEGGSHRLQAREHEQTLAEHLTGCTKAITTMTTMSEHEAAH